MTRTAKIFTASIAALTLGASVAATPAAAGGWHHRGYGWGAGGVAAGLIGAMTVGAIAASAANSYDTCVVRQRVYDDYGNFIGYRRVRTAC